MGYAVNGVCGTFPRQVQLCPLEKEPVRHEAVSPPCLWLTFWPAPPSFSMAERTGTQKWQYKGWGFFPPAIFPNLTDGGKTVISRVTISVSVLRSLFWDGKRSPNPAGTVNTPVFMWEKVTFRGGDVGQYLTAHLVLTVQRQCSWAFWQAAQGTPASPWRRCPALVTRICTPGKEQCGTVLGDG